MAVEPLPEGGWDWVVWASDRADLCLHGSADTSEDGMREAERAVLLLNGANSIFLVRSALALHRIRETLY
jgi:hypothetical protein